MSSSFRDAHIYAKAASGTTVDCVLSDDYDVVIAASSWDRRSVAIANASMLRGTVAVLFLFEERDPFGLRDSHDETLDKYLNVCCEKVVLIEGQSRDVEHMWTKMCQPIAELHRSLRRPLKVLVDLSCTPRYYSLGTVGSLMPLGIISDLSFLYAEGIYPEETREMERYELFTRGGWDAVPIPGLDGEWDVDKAWLYLVAVGFEGSKTLRLVSRAEPDKVAILFPDPAVQDGYVKRAWDRNEALFKRFNVDESRIIRSHAADAVAAWKGLVSAGLDNPGNDNCILVCCGTKPHSLALALRATTRRQRAVHYIIPDRHLVTDVQAKGIYWRYDVRDATAIRSESR